MIGILGIGRHGRLRDLLSAYIDGEVSESEATRVEEHLSGCEECRRELGTLRATVELLGQLPEMAPQRTYTLAATPEPIRRGWTVAWTVRAATSLAGLLVAALLVGDAFGIVTQRDVRETELVPAVAPAAASREIEGEVVVEREVIKEVVKAVEAPVAAMAAPAPREIEEVTITEQAVIVEKEVIKEVPVEAVVETEVVKQADAPVAEMAAPAPLAAPESAQTETAAAAPPPVTAQAMAPPADAAQPEAPIAATREAAEGAAQVELTAVPRKSEVKPAPEDGAVGTTAPLAPPVPAVSASPLQPDLSVENGFELPLWQLEVAAAASFLALVLGMLWSARRARRPWR